MATETHKQTQGNPRVGERGPGRPKGSKNKIPTDIKHYLQESLMDERGGKGTEFFVSLKTSDIYQERVAYANLIKAILPKDVAVTGGMQIRIVTGMDPSLREPGVN